VAFDEVSAQRFFRFCAFARACSSANLDLFSIDVVEDKPLTSALPSTFAEPETDGFLDTRHETLLVAVLVVTMASSDAVVTKYSLVPHRPWPTCSGMKR
jgi:hypothetical protein